MVELNIVFILVDDLGWKDIACYGSEFYETPNLDRLAQEGISFTDAYASCPVCSPTRGSILTGKYPATLGLTDWIDSSGSIHPCKGKLIDAPYIDHLSLDEKSLASALKEAHYNTWHVGKWHLGGEPYHPDKHGFDVNIGGSDLGMPINGYFSPYDLPQLSNGPKGEYLTDRLTDEAIELIKNNDSKPFFLNMWYYSVHTPIQAKKEYIEKFTTKAQTMGLDQIEAFEEGEFFPMEWKRDQRVVRRLLQSDPTYAAMIYSLDENIGRLLAILDETGQTENTVVIFTSDNGGLATAGGSPTSNAPLSEGKGWMYEGGTREPLIVKWPEVIEPGSTCSTPVTSPDFYPTLLDIAGLELMPEQHCDGVSLLSLLKGANTLERDAIFWHYPHYGDQGGAPGSSIRFGDYKLIEFFEDGKVELYNLREDIGEEHNLAGAEPERTAKLQAALASWREAVAAKVPRVNPDYVS